MAFTVTANQGGSTTAGMETALLVFTGQAASPIGSAPAGVTSATPSVAITPDVTGSYIAGTQLGLSSGGAFTPLGTTTYFEQPAGGGLEFGPFHGTATAGGSPQTMGSSAGTGISAVAIEIKTAPTLAASSLSGFVNATAATSGSVSPANGSLLVLLVASNGGGSTTTMSITDTSGLGLSWTEQVKQNGAGNGYTGIWTTTIPSGATSGKVQALATVPVPRRQPARVFWATSNIVRTTNAHGPNGTVQPRATVPVPRRALTRVRWSTNVIVATVNAPPSPAPLPSAGIDESRRGRKKFWILGL